MRMVEEIRELYAYNRWANRAVLAACGRLDAEELTRDLKSSFPSVLATLVHILSAEWIWLERWQGSSPKAMPERWRTFGLDALTEQWREVEHGQIAFLERLTETALESEIAYRSLAGEGYQAPLWQLLRHVPNHSTYHRGQVVTMLRQLGATAPATDLVLFYRERAAAPPRDMRSPPAPAPPSGT
jgi:uncharacterized damage-inducible protein DinB